MTFQEQRRKGIGASDTAAILGLSEWGNAYTVAVEKIMGHFQPESEHLKWGKAIEPLLLAEFRERTGYDCVVPTPFWEHPEYKFIYANCDGIQQNHNPEYVVEAKCSRFGEGFGPDGSDEIPDVYHIQVQHQMACTGARVAFLIVLIGGNNCRVYKINYNPEVVNTFIPILVEFWTDFVKGRILPEPDFQHPSTTKVLKQVIGLDESRQMIIDEPGHHLYDLAGRYELMRKVEKLAKDEKDSLKSQIRVQSQGAGLIMFPDGTKIVTKTQRRRGYVVKESEYETMLLTWKGDEQIDKAMRSTGIKPLELGDMRTDGESPNFE